MALVTGQGILGPGGDGAGPAPGRTPDPKASVSVVVDLPSLRRGQVTGGGRCEIPGVGPVPVDHARALLGDALVELLVADGTDVTTVYSAGRHVPRRVRSALLLRDPRCVVPGCDARLGLENDHWVTDFAKGGPTALDNLARLCHRHHQDRTHRGFSPPAGRGHLGVDRPRAARGPQAAQTIQTARPGRTVQPGRAVRTGGHRPTPVRPASAAPAGVRRGPAARRARARRRRGTLTSGPDTGLKLAIRSVSSAGRRHLTEVERPPPPGGATDAHV